MSEDRSYTEDEAPDTWQLPLRDSQVVMDYRGRRIMQGDRVEANWMGDSFPCIITGALPPQASDYGHARLVLRRESDGRLIERAAGSVTRIDPPHPAAPDESGQPMPITPEEQIDNLKQRVQRLEETVLHLSNTFAFALDSLGSPQVVPRSAARRMWDENQQIAHEEERRLRWSFDVREANKRRYLDVVSDEQEHPDSSEETSKP